jgi:hypothetical protein
VIDSGSLVCSEAECRGSRKICQVVDGDGKSRIKIDEEDEEGPEIATSLGQQRLPGKILWVEMLQDM